jgi:hypothetical protein
VQSLKTSWNFTRGETQLIGLKKGASKAEIQAAIAMLEAALTPAKPEQHGACLARLRALTKARNESQRELDLQAAAYVTACRHYPAFAVRHACKTLAETEKFFPAWAELKAKCDEAVGWPSALLVYLRAAERRVQ